MNASDLLLSASIPGTDAPKRGLFLGRAGSLLPFVKSPPLPEIAPALFSDAALGSLFRATQAGWIVYLLGNEEAVASGTVSDGEWERFESDLLTFLAAQGVAVRRNYACLEHPRGKGKHRRDSVFLFPNTGALYHAAQADGIDLTHSWLVAHRTCELAAGWRAGCRTLRVGSSSEVVDADLAVEPEISVASLADALSILLSNDAYAHR
jgi:D-glycero-D-manno-heptose 1,7-bisphosphate phosphatase